MINKNHIYFRNAKNKQTPTQCNLQKPSTRTKKQCNNIFNEYKMELGPFTAIIRDIFLGLPCSKLYIISCEGSIQLFFMLKKNILILWSLAKRKSRKYGSILPGNVGQNTHLANIPFISFNLMASFINKLPKVSN